MNKSLLTYIASFVLFLIGKFSYFGIIVLMGLESANIPIPSELIMPFAGYLVYQGKMNIFIAALSGAIGCTLGSILSYYLGYYGGRPLLEKYGKYLLLTKHDLDLGDKLFARYGDSIAFFSRLLPIIRTFISFPAGIAKTNIKKFVVYSFVGSFIWSFLLAYVGLKIGANQEAIGMYFHKFDLIIEILIFISLAVYIYTHIKKLTNK